VKSEASIDEIVTQSRWATTVGKVCDQFGGEVQTGPFGSQLHASDYSEDGTPVVMPQDMSEGKIICNRIARVGQRHVNQLKRHMLRVGDVVYSRRGDVTRFAVVTGAEEGWLCGTGSIRIRLNCPEIEVGYVRRYLQQEPVGKWLKHHAKGVTMPNLNTNIIRALPFVYPPLAEQRRIAEVLDRAEALQAKRREALGELDYLTQSLFLDMFGDPATNPKGFPKKPLASLIRDYDTINYGVVQPGDALDEGVPLVRVGDLIDGKVSHSNLKRIAPSIEAAYKRSRLRGDEILVSCVGSIGVVALANDSVKGFNIARAVARIPIAETTSRLFMAAYLSTDFVQRYFTNELRTVSQPTLNIKQLSETTVVLPPIELQREFADRVRAGETLKTAQRASLAELDALFASLQHRAFRGELVT
jgi:type I restriction enzyme S subunit